LTTFTASPKTRLDILQPGRHLKPDIHVKGYQISLREVSLSGFKEEFIASRISLQAVLKISSLPT